MYVEYVGFEILNSLLHQNRCSLSDAPVGVSIDSDNGKSTIKKGDDVTLICTVDKSNPAVTSYGWYQDGARKWVTSKQLQIKSINPEHRGKYTCKATNRVGSATSRGYQLTVHCKLSADFLIVNRDITETVTCIVLKCK